MPKTFILSLGGSLIFPESLDKKFLLDFKKLIEKYIKKNCRFVIICGGGKLARNFQKAASGKRKLSSDELDWLGIYATKINAGILQSMFGNNAEDSVVSNPNSKINFSKNVVIASGWIPGWSTDYDAVLLAKNLGKNEVINMSNVDYVYERDPKKYKNAKRLGKMKWKDFRKMSGSKWKAGMNIPFDPIAAKESEKSKMKVFIIGKDLKNLENLLDGNKFKGTVIE